MYNPPMTKSHKQSIIGEGNPNVETGVVSFTKYKRKDKNFLYKSFTNFFFAVGEKGRHIFEINVSITCCETPP